LTSVASTTNQSLAHTAWDKPLSLSNNGQQEQARPQPAHTIAQSHIRAQQQTAHFAHLSSSAPNASTSITTVTNQSLAHSAWDKPLSFSSNGQLEQARPQPAPTTIQPPIQQSAHFAHPPLPAPNVALQHLQYLPAEYMMLIASQLQQAFTHMPSPINPHIQPLGTAYFGNGNFSNSFNNVNSSIGALPTSSSLDLSLPETLRVGETPMEQGGPTKTHNNTIAKNTSQIQVPGLNLANNINNFSLNNNAHNSLLDNNQNTFYLILQLFQTLLSLHIPPNLSTKTRPSNKPPIK
jgi:hypothetical protein